MNTTSNEYNQAIIDKVNKEAEDYAVVELKKVMMAMPSYIRNIKGMTEQEIDDEVRMMVRACNKIKAEEEAEEEEAEEYLCTVCGADRCYELEEYGVGLLCSRCADDVDQESGKRRRDM
jgi:hypothetical protein